MVKLSGDRIVVLTTTCLEICKVRKNINNKQKPFKISYQESHFAEEDKDYDFLHIRAIRIAKKDFLLLSNFDTIILYDIEKKRKMKYFKLDLELIYDIQPVYTAPT